MKTNEEIVEYLQQADPHSTCFQQSMTLLLERCKDMVLRKAHTYYLSGGHPEDLVQEGMVGLYQAIRDFDPALGVPFASFANLCIDRKIRTAVKASLREKHKILSHAVSYDQMLSRKDGSRVPLKEVLSDEGRLSPEKIVQDQDETNDRIRSLNKQLSPMEKKVFSLYLDGRTYLEIAEAMNISPKSADNALQRIKQKASRLEDTE